MSNEELTRVNGRLRQISDSSRFDHVSNREATNGLVLLIVRQSRQRDVPNGPDSRGRIRRRRERAARGSEANLGAHSGTVRASDTDDVSSTVLVSSSVSSAKRGRQKLAFVLPPGVHHPPSFVHPPCDCRAPVQLIQLLSNLQFRDPSSRRLLQSRVDLPHAVHLIPPSHNLPSDSHHERIGDGGVGIRIDDLPLFLRDEERVSGTIIVTGAGEQQGRDVRSW